MQIFYDINFPLANNQQESVEALHITYSGDSPIGELPKFKNLKELDLKVYKTLPTDSLLGYFPHLEKLTLEGKVFDLYSLGNLTSLKSLNLMSVETAILPEEIGYLPQLEFLQVHSMPITALPASLNRLKKLRELRIENCKKLKTLPEEIFDLARLEVFSLTNSGIESLSTNIARLTQLTNLNLSYSNLKQLPDSLVACTLPLYFLNTPLSQKMGEQATYAFPDFMAKLQNEVADLEKRKAFFNLRTGNVERVKAQNMPLYVLEAMNFGESYLRTMAMTYWYAQNPSPFPPQEKIVIHLTPPKDFKLDWEEVTPLLEAHNIEISPRLNKDVTHLIIGSRAGKALEKAVAMNVPIVSYGHLQDFLRSLDSNIYLAEDSEDTHAMAENLQKLLRSEEDTNIDLGLQMALGGGLNPLYFYDILLFYIWRNDYNVPRIRSKLVEQILEKHLPMDVFLHLKAVHQSQRYFSEEELMHYLANVASHDYVDADDLAIAFYEKFDQGRVFCLSQPNSFLWYCHKKRKNSVLRLNNCEIAELSDSIGKVHGLKILYLQDNKLSELPDSIAQLTQLDTLSLRQNQFKHFPIVLTQFPRLASLEISSNQLTELPEEIGNIKSLVTLNISDNNITKLPTSIYDLPALRRLEIGKSNPVYRKRREIQEKMPYCKVE